MNGIRNYYGAEITRPEGTVTKEYRLPPTFAMDHYDRGCGENDGIIKTNARVFIVEMDADGFRDMLTDADYYHDMRSEMDGLESICRSAKRALESLLEQGPPPGYMITRQRYSYAVVPSNENGAE